MRLTTILAARRERDDVVQLSWSGLEEAADIARGLADALLVFDQRDAHVALAALAEARARRHCDLGLLDQQFRKLDAAERLERLGDRRPGEHRRFRRRHIPAGATEALDQDVAPLLIGLAHVLDAFVRSVERRG